MTRYHAELLRGTIGDAAKELAEACLLEFDTWAIHEPYQAAGMNPTDPKGAAETALYDMRGLLDDYLAARLALVLTSWGLDEAAP